MGDRSLDVERKRFLIRARLTLAVLWVTLIVLVVAALRDINVLIIAGGLVEMAGSAYLLALGFGWRKRVRSARHEN